MSFSLRPHLRDLAMAANDEVDLVLRVRRLLIRGDYSVRARVEQSPIGEGRASPPRDWMARAVPSSQSDQR